jgi:DNA-binding NarL/FixJ family response regulator
MRVCIVDDHEVVREGVRAALEKDPAVRVVAEAETAGDALARLSRVHTDIVITDYRLPDMTGDLLCRKILAAHPAVRVVVLTTFLTQEVVRSCFDAGAAAFVTKAAGLGELRDALRRVRAGDEGRESSSATVARLFDSSSVHPVLTPRQENVLTLAADGWTYDEIAARLSISQSTVRFHMNGLKSRLGARTKTDLVAIAIREALISPSRGERS